MPEGHLLKDFKGYKQCPWKKLKLYREKAIRTGFTKAWQDQDFKMIIDTVEKIYKNALQQDPKLPIWYDLALTGWNSKSIFGDRS